MQNRPLESRLGQRHRAWSDAGNDMDIARIKSEYFDQGYVIVDDAIDPGMLDRLEAGARSVWSQVREGAVDVAGNGPDGGSIFGLLAPEFGEPVFGEILAYEGITRYAEAFLGPELRMGHVHLWAADGGYDTGWHRDLGPAKDNTYDEEMALLSRPMIGLRYQVALVDDPCLWLVPGSHRRYRTEEERQALAFDGKRDISTQVNVPLKRGEMLLWSGYTVHRGRKPPDLEQRLSMTIGLFRYDPQEPKMAMDERFRWKLADNIRDSLPPRSQLYYDRWRALQPE